MAETDPTGSGWRVRWANRENERRQRGYDVAVKAWRQRDDELRRLRAATDFRGSAEAACGLPVELCPDEVVFSVLPAAQLVEAPHVTCLPAPELTVVPVSVAALRSRPGDGIKVTDAGIAVVTDRRVVFQSRRRRREWAYAKMNGLAHDPGAPCTLMQVLNRQQVSGLLLPSAAVPGFRFHLTLAFADAIEQRAAVIAQLDELTTAHEALRPARPVPVTPDEAAFLAGGRLAAAAAVTIVVLVPVAAFQSDSPVRPQPEAATAAVVPSARPVIAFPAPAAAVPSPTPGAATKATAETLPTRTPAPRSERTTAAPTTRTASLCGAPANPYGYHFCGGSRVYEPASGVCRYFECIEGFWSGKGYLVQCRDGTVSMTGGRSESCVHHGGRRRAVHT